MNANTKLERIRELAQMRALELQPFAGEEMNLPQNDPHRDGFIAGERALAARILELLDDKTETKTESGEAAAPSGYSRGEGQKPVSAAYKENWNAIFAKKKAKRKKR